MGADGLARTLTEAEFTDWQTYARHRMLPQRRIEMLLAQIALVLVRVNGNQHAKLADFLFDPQPAGGRLSEDMTADEEADFFDFKPVTKPPKD